MHRFAVLCFLSLCTMLCATALFRTSLSAPFVIAHTHTLALVTFLLPLTNFYFIAFNSLAQHQK